MVLPLSLARDHLLKGHCGLVAGRTIGLRPRLNRPLSLSGTGSIKPPSKLCRKNHGKTTLAHPPVSSIQLPFLACAGSNESRPLTLSRYQASLLGLTADLRMGGRALRSSVHVALWAAGGRSSPTRSSLETACVADSSASDVGEWLASTSSRQIQSAVSSYQLLKIDHAP